ncbi:MAG TPA: hypothetical protein VK753_11195 [Xanthomonadaceae bacterium]|jgi:tetratricopeptide (TPR) repeat protein|nr:hypothetical protein [Xanthomonadaceae bacterium]
MQLPRMVKMAGLAMAIAMVPAAVATAQELHDRYLEIKKQYEKDHPGKTYTNLPTVKLFPNATRVDPGLTASDHMVKPLVQLTDLINYYGHDAEAIALGEKLAADSRATPYDLAHVFAALGQAHLDEHDGAAGVEYIRKSLDENALSNNDQYTLMRQLVDAQIDLGQPDAGLATLVRLVAETREDRPEYDGLRGHMYYMKGDYTAAAQALQKALDESSQAEPSWQQMLMDSCVQLRQYDRAAKVGETILHAHPDDPSAVMKLVAIYQQARQVDKVQALLEDAHRRGALTTADGYEALYDLYSRTKGREGDGVALMNEGLQKGILQPSERVYVVLARGYESIHQPAQAIDAYAKADAAATDGEAALDLAELYSLQGRSVEARAAAIRALQKGVIDPGWARVIISRQDRSSSPEQGTANVDTSDWKPWDSH